MCPKPLTWRRISPGLQGRVSEGGVWSCCLFPVGHGNSSSGVVRVPVGEGGADTAEGILGQAATRVASVEEFAVIHEIEQLRSLAPLRGEAAAGRAIGRGERRRKARWQCVGVAQQN